MSKNRGILISPANSDSDERKGFVLENGSLAIGDTTYQNLFSLLSAHPGEFKEFPGKGIGISDIVLDNDLLYWKHKIRQQLESEGMRVNSIEFNKNSELVIDANYL